MFLSRICVKVLTASVGEGDDFAVSLGARRMCVCVCMCGEKLASANLGIKITNYIGSQ